MKGLHNIETFSSKFGLAFFSMYVGIWLKRVAMSTSYAHCSFELLLSSFTTCSDHTDGSRVDCKVTGGVRCIWWTRHFMQNNYPRRRLFTTWCFTLLVWRRLHWVFPNLTADLRLLFTVPVTVASAERYFSKLKLINTYLRSTMTQNGLVG